jgi:hypothetical protein
MGGTSREHCPYTTPQVSPKPYQNNPSLALNAAEVPPSAEAMGAHKKLRTKQVAAYYMLAISNETSVQQVRTDNPTNTHIFSMSLQCRPSPSPHDLPHL